jgi:flagellar motor switch protein FliM
MNNEDIGQPLLSAEETNALLDVMRADVSPQTQAQGIDIGSPERYLRGSLIYADQCTRAVAKQFLKIAMRFTGFQLLAEDMPAEIIPYKMIPSSFVRGSVIALLKTQERGFALVTIGPSVIAFLLECRLGARLDTEQPAPLPTRNALSPLELRVIEPFALAIGDEFFEKWCQQSHPFRLERLISEIEGLPVTTDFEPLLQMTLRFSSPYCAGDSISVALSSAAVRETLPRESHGPKVVISASDRARILPLVKEATVRTVAVLGTAQSTIGHVLALKVGDIVRLDTAPDQPIDLHVRGAVIARGVPVVNYGNIALQVLETYQGESQ